MAPPHPPGGTVGPTASTPLELARAFSGHRFEEVYDRLADDVRWVTVGAAVISGRDAVVDACRSSSAALAGTQVEYLRFVTAGGTGPHPTQRIAVDTVARYRDAGGTTLVSSCDVYEFRGGRVAAITSYAVEVDPQSEEGRWHLR
jgi:limonene-1,2-epoxide hydrolase